ncbi:hypothetical protein K435DRAFT_702707 [Dendrothele bispora CBS 962.96]|uniref:Uncharacterized protein n=1 Tax=Dendrothele bispora (strain CBS 962.96) TaxID=1314807 RepID=A0A4S8KNT7_DENBC|nr:hypothetical protein K435DRAFT_702707 [Dendrothele bispora CBS 962.96]
MDYNPGSTTDTATLVSPNKAVFASYGWTIVLGYFCRTLFWYSAAGSLLTSVASHLVLCPWIIWTAAAVSVTEMLGGGSNCNYMQFHPSESLTSPIPNATDAFFLLALSVCPHIFI